jgi:hypothetical protein
MGWIHLAQDADIWQSLVNTVMNFVVPKYLRSSATAEFSRRTRLRVVKYY